VRKIREPSRGRRSGLLCPPPWFVCVFESLRFKIFSIEVNISSMALYQDHLFLASPHRNFLWLKTSHKYFLYLARQDRQAMTLHMAIFRAHFWQGLPYPGFAWQITTGRRGDYDAAKCRVLSRTTQPAA
jgi:hypothetical protein